MYHKVRLIIFDYKHDKHFVPVQLIFCDTGPLVSPSIRCDDSSLVNIDADEYVQTLSYIGGHRRIGVTR